MSNTELKTTFNTAPTLYEDVRPGYPEELIQDVLNHLWTQRSPAEYLKSDAAPEKQLNLLRDVDMNWSVWILVLI